MTKTPGTKEDWFFAFESYVILYMTKTLFALLSLEYGFESYVI